jgi:hypothetical protein
MTPSAESLSYRKKTEILSRCSERKRGNVEAFWALLLKLHRQGVRNFTLAVVGKASQKSGGVKLQSLMNKGGADYRELLKAFAEDVGATQPTTGRKASPLEQAIETIADLDIRTRLRMILSQHKRFADDNDRLREILRRSQSLPEESAAAPAGGASASVTGSSIALRANGEPQRAEPEALIALARFVSDEWMDERRWNVDEHGTVYDEYGERVTPHGFVINTRLLLVALGHRSVT